MAGAPVSLFGPEGSPTFEAAFEELASAGYDTFLPLFVLSENEDVSTYSAHGSFFAAPSLSGSTVDVSCAGPHDPYAAAEGHLDIWYPGVQLLGTFDLPQPLPATTLRSALSTQLAECPTAADVAAFYALDEPSLNNVVAEYLGQPPIHAANAATIADEVRASWGVPVVSVEAPGELALSLQALPEEEIDRLVEDFWADARTIAEAEDGYGFNV